MARTDDWLDHGEGLIDKEWVNRKNGILTAQDRKYLLGALDLEEQYKDPAAGERKLKHRIRTRAANGIRDMLLLSYALEQGDIEDMFDDPYDSEEYTTENEYHATAQSLILLATRLIDDLGILRETVEHSVNEGIKMNSILRYGEVYFGDFQADYRSQDGIEPFVSAGELRAEADRQEFVNQVSDEDGKEFLRRRIYEANQLGMRFTDSDSA